MEGPTPSRAARPRRISHTPISPRQPCHPASPMRRTASAPKFRRTTAGGSPAAPTHAMAARTPSLKDATPARKKRAASVHASALPAEVTGAGFRQSNVTVAVRCRPENVECRAVCTVGSYFVAPLLAKARDPIEPSHMGWALPAHTCSRVSDEVPPVDTGTPHCERLVTVA